MSKFIAIAASAVLMTAVGTAQARDHGGTWTGPHRHTVSAPEIEAASAGAALVLLTGGIYVLFRRQGARKD
jgi:hypothetical protein